MERRAWADAQKTIKGQALRMEYNISTASKGVLPDEAGGRINGNPPLSAVCYTFRELLLISEEERKTVMPIKKRGPEPGSEKARHGGQAVREKYGPDFYRQIGQKGGQSVKAQRGSAFYAEIGRKGGEATRAHHGPDFYARIGKAGGEKGHRGKR